MPSTTGMLNETTRSREQIQKFGAAELAFND